MPRGISYSKLETIKQKIESLDDNNQKIILKLIRDDNVIFTENINGVFFDIVAIDVKTLQKIQSYLDFFERSEKVLDERSRDIKDILRENSRS